MKGWIWLKTHRELQNATAIYPALVCDDVIVQEWESKDDK